MIILKEDSLREILEEILSNIHEDEEVVEDRINQIMDKVKEESEEDFRE